MTQQRSNESGDPYAYTDPDEEMTFRLANEHPALLARVLELEQENERLRKQVDRKRDLASRINKSFRGALVRAEDAEHERDAALALLADAIPDPKGAIDSPQWHRRMDALAAGLSLQEEQPTHLVGAGGWRACDTAADWAGSDTTGVTCAECLATTTDALLQEEQE